MLACVSVMAAGRDLSELRLRDLDADSARVVDFGGARGSTCTMSSQTWTMERTREVLPMPEGND